VGLIQRVLDEAGLCTLSVTQVAEIAAIVKPSRSLFVPHPFGLTFGDIGDGTTQAAVVDLMLETAVSMDTQGIKVSPFRWDKDEMRYRQLRKLKG
jgi:hypothetical protein